IVAIRIPVATANSRAAFDELARRRGDYAVVGAGIDAEFDGGLVTRMRIAFLAVGSTPVRARSAEAVLTGQALTPDTIRAAQHALDADLDPPEDEHTPAAMR